MRQTTHAADRDHVFIRSVRNVLKACWAGALMAVLLTVPALAGTGEDPEITDPPGDANFINGQGVVSGQTGNLDTRPASLDHSDLTGVWFETAYTADKVVDPATGEITGVNHHPTDLLIHVRTLAPARPMSPWDSLQYKVRAALPECSVSFDLQAYAANPSLDFSRLVVTDGTCGQFGPGQGPYIPVRPSFEGNVSTITVPLQVQGMPDLLSIGTTISQPAAHVFTNRSTTAGGSDKLLPDVTGPGRDFSVGQDVPADIDCSTDPDDPECQP